MQAESPTFRRAVPVVALIVPSFPTYSETFIVSKFLGLLNRGWDVHVVCNRTTKDWGRFPELIDRDDVRRRVHVSWPTKNRAAAAAAAPVAIGSAVLKNPSAAARYIKKAASKDGSQLFKRLYLDAHLIALQPDIVHFEFGTLAPERIHLKEYVGAKVVVSFRGFDLNYVGLEDPTYYDSVWASADALHLLGRDLWDRAQRRGCPTQKPRGFIPPAIDAEFFRPDRRDHANIVGTTDRPLKIVSVGRLSWKKGYEYALQAVHSLKDAGCSCEFTIVGGGDHLRAVAFARHQLGLDNDVTLAGAQSREYVRQALEEADVFLHSAVSEGFCNAVLEAQAMELPVVTSDADGLRENVLDGQTGFVVPRRDPAALARKLAKLASDPDLRRRMGKLGRERVLEHFQLQDQIDRFDALYHAVLNENGKLAGEIDLGVADAHHEKLASV